MSKEAGGRVCFLFLFWKGFCLIPERIEGMTKNGRNFVIIVL